ncbi:MAG: 50S ribosomal protein L21 [Candidatus Jidaibacter sp.]|jgi:large subunit ribosomal protein L21|nr:50S ribosomal protein L21 [Candidatus Jidaibacter sp.]
MFAVFETGSKQYHVKTGDIIKVEKLIAEVGSSVNFDRVLSIAGKVGKDTNGASVIAEVIEQRKNDKEIIFKKKRRHNYRRKRGHRQLITVLKITELKS